MAFAFSRLSALLPLLVLSQPALLHAEWFRETVDDSLPAGFACSLALDAADQPHVAYWRQAPNFPTFFSPAYATTAGQAWHTEEVGSTSTMQFGPYTSIVIGEGGRPAIAYQTSGTLLYHTQMNANGEWPLVVTSIASNTGDWLSMIWDPINPPTPEPRIASSQGTSLSFLRPNGANWTSSTVDTTNAGTSCSMDIHSSGEVGIAYIKGGNIRYASALQGNTPSPPDALVFPQNLSATRCAFTFDANGRSHIFYYDEASASYRHISNELENGAWTPQPATVAAVGQRAIDFYGCSIAGGSDGSLHVAFLDYTTNTLKYGRRAPGSATWSIESVDTFGSTGGSCQIQLDSRNRPRIAYHDITNSRLRYARRLDALAFTIEGKKKRVTRKKSVPLSGSATDSAVSVEWRIGKKAFRSSDIPAGGKWKLTARGLKPGRNKIELRARGLDGTLTGLQVIRAIRK